jgi:CubicO group peptidase (beta-lactamase class C family)
MEREPYVGEEYSGGGVTLMQLALTDAQGRPFEDILDDLVLGPAGMERSTFVQPLPEEWDRNAARGHDGEGASRGPKWHVYPELAAAGLWTTPTDLAHLLIEVQKSMHGESNRVLSRESTTEMLSPVGVGGYGVGFAVSQRGRGWYFGHGGANWGFRATILAHQRKGYGLAIMTNADQGGGVAAELSRRIQAAYGWDSLEEELPRGYDPPREVDNNELTSVSELVVRQRPYEESYRKAR